MSKRYGRNQKRKHREQIAQLEKDKISTDKRLSQALSANRIYEDIDEDIRRLLGKHSAFRLKSCEEYWRDLPDVHREFALSPISVASFNPDELVSPVAMAKIQDLHRFMVHVQSDPVQFRHRIRLVARNETISALYLDDQYIHEVGFTPRDIRWLAEEIAHQMAHVINTEVKNGNLSKQ